MKHPGNLLLTALSLALLLASCTTGPSPDPLVEARKKIAEATTISFTLNSEWNNTYKADTSVDRHTAIYRPSEHPIFPYDFVYRMGDFTSAMIDGELRDINYTRGEVISYTPEEAADDIGYEGNYATMNSPLVVIQDTLWQRNGSMDQDAVYEYEEIFPMDGEPDRHRLHRLRIDTVHHFLVSIESFLTQGGEPFQHIAYHYSLWNFNDPEELSVNEADYHTIAYADVQRREKAARLQPGDRFPGLVASDLDGNPVEAASLLGKKTVYVFSFIGCGGCEHARQELAKMDFAFAPEYQGVYLSPRDEAPILAAYQAKKPWPLRMATTDYDFAERCGVFAYPTFITVSEYGEVEQVLEGYEEGYFTSKAAK